jgi:hypothetical protein
MKVVQRRLKISAEEQLTHGVASVCVWADTHVPTNEIGESREDFPEEEYRIVEITNAAPSAPQLVAAPIPPAWMDELAFRLAEQSYAFMPDESRPAQRLARLQVGFIETMTDILSSVQAGLANKSAEQQHTREKRLEGALRTIEQETIDHVAVKIARAALADNTHKTGQGLSSIKN